MISNNSSYKLKASKSSRDNHDYQDEQSEENYDTDSVDGDVTGDTNRRYQFYNSRDGRYRGIRSRHEYRSSRGGDRRGSYRGRGFNNRRNDYSDGSRGGYVVTRKYQDPLTRPETVSSYSSMYFDSEKRTDVKFSLPEDTRISKLLRRLSIESDQENSLTISKKLLEVLMLPDNAHYVRKAFHILGESMLDIFQNAPGLQAKRQAARGLGRMGYIMGQENDFDRFQNWLFSKITNGTDDMQNLFMQALKEIVCLERQKPVLQKHSSNLMRDLVLLIEVTDNIEVFKGALENLMSLSEIYSEEFYSLFRDTTDLLFGWHVDHTQPLSNIEFISRNMLRIARHFQINLEFSITLVVHFVEDIETYTNQLYIKDSEEENSSIEHVTVFILALNTVLKCLGDSLKTANNDLGTLKILTDCLTQIVKTATETLEAFVPDNLTIAANECISILVEVVSTKSLALHDSILNLIDLELSLTQEFSDSTIISMFLMISKVVKELSPNLPIELIPKLVGPESEVIKQRHSFYVDVQEAVICVYQSLLNLKNIPLLQEAYRYILGDLEVVYKEIVPDIKPLCQNNPFATAVCREDEAELTVLFLLRCLSQLANASGSIIGMWAIKPSILELLGVFLEPYNKKLAKKTPALQYSLMYLLYSHCKCYNQFVSSSCLISDNVIGRLGLSDGLSIEEVGGKSPNSGNLSIILEVLFKSLSNRMNAETILLLLQWLSDILLHGNAYLEMLYVSKEFTNLAGVLVKVGYSKDCKIALMVCGNLEKLLNKKQLSWKNKFLSNINDLCILHMKSNREQVRKAYTQLSINIPWDIAVVELERFHNLERTPVHKNVTLSIYTNYSVILAQHLHMNGTLCGEILPFHFKTLMKYLLDASSKTNQEEEVLENIFSACWPTASETQNLNEHFKDLALSSKVVLNNWSTWEAAQLCINTKLRTPLGKPNETFTTFENSLKEFAKSLTTNKIDPKQVRLLLQFMEHLEVLITNASDGSAIALPQVSKPVRTFFSTNSTTCKEWFSRIRLILIQLALHTGQSTIALRHGYSLLRDLQNKIDTCDLERAVVYVALALVNLKEPEALHGLYVWCKNTTKCNFKWILIAAEQASKRFESASKGYKAIVADFEKEKKLPSEQFVKEQLLNCYKELNNWVGIKDCIATENNDYDKHSFSNIDSVYVDIIFNIENGVRTFEELATWKEDDSEESWSIYSRYRGIEKSLFNIASTVGMENTKNLLDIDKILSDIGGAIQENLLVLSAEFLQDFYLLNYIAHGLKNVLNNIPANSVFLVSEEFEMQVDKIDSSILSKILWWSEYFSNVQTQGFNTFSNNLRLNIVKKARKEHNFNLACHQLYNFLHEKDLLQSVEKTNCYSMLNVTSNSLLLKIPEINLWTLDTARAITEMIKLIYSDPESRELTFNLCAVASTSISKHAELFGGAELREVSSRILLNLAKWLQNNEQVSLTEINSPLGKFLMVLPEVAIIEDSGIIPMNEMAIGKLLQFSVHQCTGLAKAWNEFGTWCYKWGRKIVGRSLDLNFTEEDRKEIKNLLPDDVSQENLNKIYLILSQTRASVDDEDIDSNEINTSEMIQNQLQNVPVLRCAHPLQFEGLVNIWKKIQKRVYIYYELSAEAYFKYLHLTSNGENVKNSITVTLRLLRLIVKYALELQNVLEDGLASTPTHPWKVIIPQLFSRLNHPEVYVRQRVSELLRRIAEDAPHLITFPAVVGALEGGVKFDFSEISLSNKDCLSQTHEHGEYTELNEIESPYDSDVDETKNDLQACFKSMVETLSKQAPETINQVQLLVKELRRIILLWDELWLGTLAQHHTEINKRQQQLEAEIEKVNENPYLNEEEKASLITEKHRIIIKPIIFVLEQLYDITSVDPETPHEKQFQERYLDTILEILEKLKTPQNPDKPEESWQLFKMLQSKFQQKANKGAYSLKMSDISPVLAQLKDTVIAMPGLASSYRTRVTISHVSNHVSILPTKTKPKKLIFHGSDGQTYTYLFKGLEDLHLDERIMQFLSIANTMMAQSNDGSDLYRARHYSVIPLGPRSGLISWVDGTTPVFALYKRWQQREAAKHGKNSNVLRPSELFYQKLNPLLQEHGVKNIENRKEWSFNVLKHVLTELMAETPCDLITKELWCHSINAGVWWQMTRRYSYSVAVMSIIGYIIGLGDRHLDNVLIDLTSGEVVHIDYNVCFEKGKTLRVPEKVPFRLTPNFIDALGVTGTDGIFRLTCEKVLKTMKKGRETLLTLLEAFVYDPLVDWTVGGGSLAGTTYGGVVGNSVNRQTHKDLEKDITLSMYRVRCSELKLEWFENKSEIKQHLPLLKEKILNWLEEKLEITKTKDLLQDLHQQMALAKEAEANGISKHALYSLPSRYEALKKKKDAMIIAKKDLDTIILECDSHLKKYSDVLKFLEGPKFNLWLTDLNKTYDQEGIKVFDLVKEFLQNAGQTNMVAQCEHSEIEVEKLTQKQMTTTIKCLSLLREYTNILSQCPSSFMEKHRTFSFLKWSKYLLESDNQSACEEVYHQFCSLVDIKKSNLINPLLKFSYHLNVLYNESAAQAGKLYEDLGKLRLEEKNIEKLYDDAKTSISTFLQMEKGAPKAFEFVLISELILLNQNFLSLETAASRSGDFLLKLTLREGDWFLDELTLNSNRALELLSYLPLQSNWKIEDPKFLQVINGIQAANKIYKSLQELYFNFHTIILPETMKKIQSEENTVLNVIQELNNIIIGANMPLSELVCQLEKNLTSIVMKMDKNPTLDYVADIVTAMKVHFQGLLHAHEHLTPGRMLLMGFNGLFEKLEMDFTNLTNILGNLDVPMCWRKLDQIKEAKSLSAPIFNQQVRETLGDIFFLKRLQAMSEFFGLAVEMYQSFRGSGNLCVLNDEQLNKPIRKFIADFISKQFLGITTESIAYTVCFLLQHLGSNITNEIEQKDIGAENKVPLDELYHKSWTAFLKKGIFTQNVLAQASSLETNLKTAWEKLQEPKKLEQSLSMLQATVLRLRNQITIHNWLYDDIIKSNITQIGVLRSKFILDLQTEIAILTNIQTKLLESHETQKNLIASADQRLKWAAGANPDLNEILSAFEASVAEREKKLDAEQQIVNLILSTCKTIEQHENLRTQNSDSKIYDKRFLSACEKLRAAYLYHCFKIDAVSSVEENIMQLYTPDLLNNSRWVSVISEKISEIITIRQKELMEQKLNNLVTQDRIMHNLDKINICYGKHGKIMSEFKSLLKSMTKIEEYASRTHLFVYNYRKFMENFTFLVHSFQNEIREEELENSIKNVEYLYDNIDSIYDCLIDLENFNYGREMLREKSPLNILPKQESISKGQQKNAYAVGVWRRVRMKLEGRDPDPGRKYSTQEQVDYVIKEAASIDNLALLYEGWTPWV